MAIFLDRRKSNPARVHRVFDLDSYGRRRSRQYPSRPTLTAELLWTMPIGNLIEEFILAASLGAAELLAETDIELSLEEPTAASCR